MKQDIQNIEDIRLLVDSFYGRIQEDVTIGPIFNNKIQNWDTHLEKMYRFWQTVLLNEHTYNGSPFPVHMPLPIQKDDFLHWISIWQDTVDSHFSGKVADEAKWRGEKMAEMFSSKMEYFKSNNLKFPM